MPIQPGTDIGRYHVLEQLGEGGMAVVYKAYDTRLENEVAIKFIRTGSLPPDALPRLQKRFQIEAKKMARMTHPNIVNVMDYGEYEGAPYLVMPFLPGGTLKELLGKMFSVDETVNILLPIAEALSYAHGEGLVHRDIKPSNILITKTGQPILSDFGVAKVLESEETLDLTTTGMGVGTPEYMAPEQGEGRSIDHRADIYALGIVFFEMVTGRKPFTADTPMAVIVKQMRDPLPKPTLLNPNLSQEAERVLFKTLAKDPNDRYADMGVFAKAMKDLLKTERTYTNEKSDRVIPGKEYAPKEKSPRIKREEKPFDTRWLIGLMGMVGLSLIIFAGIKFFGSGEERQLTTAQDIDIATEIPETTLGIGSSMVSEKDGMTMVYVPAGESLMGSTKEKIVASNDEFPQHVVYLDAYWIYQTEVTNAMYRLCVEAGECGNLTKDTYFRDSRFEDHPVVYVSSYDSKDYCRWAGGDLPSEAQWEKAARGTEGQKYPWGNETDSALGNIDDETYFDEESVNCIINLCDGYNRISPVGVFKNGASPYGALDLAGNVGEWVTDWYGKDYYSISPETNPGGPAEGQYRVFRGGSWDSGFDEIASVVRDFQYPDHTSEKIGFRCALDAESTESLIDAISIEGAPQSKIVTSQQSNPETKETYEIGMKAIDEPIHATNTSAYDYKLEIIPVGNISFDSNVRVNIELRVDHEEQEGNSSSGLVLKRTDEKTKSEGSLYLIFQDGWWKLYYFINGGVVEGADFDYIKNPSQKFSITIHENLKSVTIINSEGFTLSHAFKEQLFFGTKSFIAFIQVGPKGSIDVSQFSIDLN